MFPWQPGGQNVDRLIAKGRYGRASRLLREQLAQRPTDVHLRQKLADTLALAGEPHEATRLLGPLVEELAAEGFLAKAIALVKKIQRIDPEHRGLEEKLAELAHRAEADAASTPRVPADETYVPNQVRAVQKSPLFSDFAADELHALIRGWRLLTYEPGEIVLCEGEPGTSLLVLASGAVRVYVRNELGHQVEIRRLGAGEIFGEISILTGQARTATITAAEPSEILELQQKTLREIAGQHPKVGAVIRDYCRARAGSPEEIQAREEIELPL